MMKRGYVNFERTLVLLYAQHELSNGQVYTNYLHLYLGLFPNIGQNTTINIKDMTIDGI